MEREKTHDESGFKVLVKAVELFLVFDTNLRSFRDPDLFPDGGTWENSLFNQDVVNKVLLETIHLDCEVGKRSARCVACAKFWLFFVCYFIKWDAELIQTPPKQETFVLHAAASRTGTSLINVLSFVALAGRPQKKKMSSVRIILLWLICVS